MQLTLRIISIFSFIVAIIWWLASPGFEPLSAFLTGLITLLTSFAFEKPNEKAESLDQRNRRVMLDHVENFWVKGILEKSLHGVALLELGIKEDPNAVNYPWGIKKTSTNETLPMGKSMFEIFKEIGLGRSLLILGAPGSGKTTMLLELARQLIEVTRKDETEPIPVVFNLASWRDKLSLADWLVEQLNIFYYVPKKTAQKFVTENKMFLLLDGLDEVKEDLREKCVDAINEFKNEYGLTSVTICSRIEEYQAILTKLSLAGAITLQPLTSEQVSSYFDKFGGNLSILREVLTRDKTLQELTETPLMLSIMVLAYKDINIKEFPELETNKEQSNHLFDTYINRMFERPARSVKEDFPKEKTLHYLGWLANQMVQHNLITYQIEAIQPSWLPSESFRNIYKLSYQLIVGLSAGIFGGLLSNMFYRTLASARISMVISVIIFFCFSVLSLFILKYLIDTGGLELVERLHWSWQSAKEQLKNKDVIFYAISCFIIGTLLNVVAIKSPYGLIGQVSYGVMAGIVLGMMIWGGSGLIFGLTGIEEINNRTFPNQGISRSLKTAFVLGFLLGGSTMIIVSIGHFFATLFLAIRSWYNNYIFLSLYIGLGIGVAIGGITFLRYGGLTTIKHYVLRFLLTQNNSLPLHPNYILEYAVDLIFLRRVGGSYIFVHRLLMEHFAEMYVEKENNIQIPI